MKTIKALALSAALTVSASAAYAADLEVMHWWTSGGEAAAVGELAKAFNSSGNKWVDAAIVGGDAARPVMISRITGGDPMGAFQFNHGRQAEELIEAGLLRDITDIAEANGWKDVVFPSSLLDACTVDGKIYCAPVNIHSWQWLWLSNGAYKAAGVDVPNNWGEFVASGPALEKAGIVPLALGQQGWQQGGLFSVLMASLLTAEQYDRVFDAKDATFAAGSEVKAIFAAASDARRLSTKSTVQNWNDATNMLITGKGGGQIMGDWAQGEFANANKVAGTDYSCLPGLGVNPRLSTGGDAFYFPVLKDEVASKAQGELAALLLTKEVQVAFNSKKGSLPVRGDVDLTTVNECTSQGLDLLAKGALLRDFNQLISADTVAQVNDLFTEFFATPDMTADAAQARFVDLIASAE